MDYLILNPRVAQILRKRVKHMDIEKSTLTMTKVTPPSLRMTILGA